MKPTSSFFYLAGGPWLVWGFAAAIAFAVWGVMMLLKSTLVQRLKQVENRTWLLDFIQEALQHTSKLFIAAFAVFIALVPIPDKTAALLEAYHVLLNLVVAGLIIQFGIWANVALNLAFKHPYVSKQIEVKFSKGATYAISLIGKFLLWSLVLLLILENLGFEIGPLLAGLGIGGIAIALAVQNILGDIFASLSIIVDKPFVVGDFIIIDDYLGSVEQIGIKTTRVRSLSGEQLIFSNADLLKSRIRNYKRMHERRVVFSFRVPYETPVEKIQEIPEIVKGIIEAEPNTRFDRAHFRTFGTYALEYEVVYYVVKPESIVYIDAQQNINIEMMKQFKSKGITFASPTKALLVDRMEDSDVSE